MIDSDHDLLVRIDERTESTHRWVLEHQQTHKDESATRLRWSIFYLGSLVTVAFKLIFGK